MRKFNTTGLCVPKMHYMVDTTEKIIEIAAMVSEGLYFTINRARQFGKTTTISSLRDRIKNEYLVIDTSFEGVGDDSFQTNENFCKMFVKLITDELKFVDVDDYAAEIWRTGSPVDMLDLGALITDFCNASSKPVVLSIDEVDKTSNNQVFLNFLGMLRNKYLKRNDGKDITFHSVILAGVYDIKNLKLRIADEKAMSARGERIHNTPWNIAADFRVDMSFKPNEIATMLTEYENDCQTGMDIEAVSDEIYRYTNGYPFLVSKICKTIDEQSNKEWTSNGIENSVKLILQENNTLFDDMFKNIEGNPKMYDLIYDIVIEGTDRAFAIGNPEIELGSMFGILINKDGKVAVSNLIFEILITNYLASKMEAQTDIIKLLVKNDAVINGRLNLQLIIEKFCRHYRELYTEQSETFLEKHGRLLFITYLKPYINGTGFYHIESETRNAERMDLVVDYGSEQFVIELKIWHGDKRHEDDYNQLYDYLDNKGFDTGYLLIFDFRKEKQKQKPKWIRHRGKRIFDAIC
jgi:hypothetical protein